MPRPAKLPAVMHVREVVEDEELMGGRSPRWLFLSDRT